jgi:putative SOS response-associated peptidase YedK
MCGRFTYKLIWAEIVKLYRLTLDQPPRNTQPRYNICPTTTIDTVISSEGKRALVPMRWGLIPAWWNKPLREMRLATFNARAETVATRPMFRDAFKSKRCLIPASGYYEWSGVPGNKQPYYFTRRDGQPITFAGLSSNWKDRESGSNLLSCTMVITEPNKLAAEVHDRMPVILEPKDFEQWERGDVKDATALMKPAGNDVLQKWPVSKRVNSSRAPDDDPTLIERLDEVSATALMRTAKA